MNPYNSLVDMSQFPPVFVLPRMTIVHDPHDALASVSVSNGNMLAVDFVYANTQEDSRSNCFPQEGDVQVSVTRRHKRIVRIEFHGQGRDVASIIAQAEYAYWTSLDRFKHESDTPSIQRTRWKIIEWALKTHLPLALAT